MLKVLRPFDCGPPPDLALRRKLRALIEAADTQRVHPRIRGRRCVDGRAAIRAEGLRAPVAAFRSLDVNLRRAAEELEGFLRRGNADSVRRAGELLAIRAMAGADFGRIDFRFVAYRPALALAGDFHGRFSE